MIFVTADTHGDMERFETKAIKKLKKTDTLFVLGDFGFIWNDDEKTEKDLKKLETARRRRLFNGDRVSIVDGGAWEIAAPEK